MSATEIDRDSVKTDIEQAVSEMVRWSEKVQQITGFRGYLDPASAFERSMIRRRYDESKRALKQKVKDAQKLLGQKYNVGTGEWS